MYGPTETTIWSTAGRVKEATSAPSIGKPIANTRVYVLEPTGELAAPGGFGELAIGGEGVARGYWNRPGAYRGKIRQYFLARWADRTGVPHGRHRPIPQRRST